MNSLTRFWTSQEVYIMKVFLPIILGFLVLFIGLLAVSALAFWWRHYRLWHLGKAENRSDQRGHPVQDPCGRDLWPRSVLEGALPGFHALFDLLGGDSDLSG